MTQPTQPTGTRNVPLLLLAALLAAGCNGHVGNGGGNGGVRPSLPARPFDFAPPPPEAGAPRLSAEEARALFRIARLDPLKARDLATLREVMQLPERMFESYGGFVVASLYLPGRREPSIGAAAGGNLAFSAAGAIRNALGESSAAELDRARVRIDLVHDVVPCDPQTRMIPGVEGLVTTSGSGQALLPPDVYLGDDPQVTDYILRLERLAALPEGTWKGGRMLLAKFRSVGLLQIDPADEPVFVYRGNVLAADPRPYEMNRAAERGFAWLRGRIRDSGAPLPAYLPYAGRDGDRSPDLLEQAAAALALLAHGRAALPERGRPEQAAALRVTPGLSLEVADRILAGLRRAAVTDQRGGFSYVASGGEIGLGEAALTLLALCERERLGGGGGDGDGDRKLLKGLADFIVKQQTPEGEFLPRYDAEKGRAERIRIQDPTTGREVIHTSLHCPGQAMLALLALDRLEGGSDKRWVEACHRGARYLVELQGREALVNARKNVKPGKIYPPDAWLIRALEALLAVEERPGYRRHLFLLADGLCAGQFTALEGTTPSLGEATPMPDLVGAMGEADPPEVPTTAVRCQGLLAALRLAERSNDVPRVTRYRRALGLAARFVIQNQYHVHNSYALSAPQRALGGFRTSPLACELGAGTAADCSTLLLEWAARSAARPSAPPAPSR